MSYRTNIVLHIDGMSQIKHSGIYPGPKQDYYTKTLDLQKLLITLTSLMISFLSVSFPLLWISPFLLCVLSFQALSSVFFLSWLSSLWGSSALVVCPGTQLWENTDFFMFTVVQ